MAWRVLRCMYCTHLRALPMLKPSIAKTVVDTTERSTVRTTQGYTQRPDPFLCPLRTRSEALAIQKPFAILHNKGLRRCLRRPDIQHDTGTWFVFSLLLRVYIRISFAASLQTYSTSPVYSVPQMQNGVCRRRTLATPKYTHVSYIYMI